MKKYDVIIIGAGPSGIFCAYELIENNKNLNILMIEKADLSKKEIALNVKLKNVLDANPVL